MDNTDKYMARRAELDKKKAKLDQLRAERLRAKAEKEQRIQAAAVAEVSSRGNVKMFTKSRAHQYSVLDPWGLVHEITGRAWNLVCLSWLQIPRT